MPRRNRLAKTNSAATKQGRVLRRRKDTSDTVALTLLAVFSNPTGSSDTQTNYRVPQVVPKVGAYFSTLYTSYKIGEKPTF